MLIIALIALFVALGGTSYAAITSLPANSVGTAQLKSNAVTGAKIKNGAITGAKISLYAQGLAMVVGAPGAPAFAGSWEAAGQSADEGRLVLQGSVGNCPPSGETPKPAVVR